MTASGPRPRVVVVADDFGSSSSVNRAIAEAHDRGILTSASLMAGGEAFDEAVEIAGKRTGLSVGLHLTLCDGKAVLPGSEIPGLADAGGRFEKSPVRAWLKYRGPALREQLDREIAAQVDRLEEAGIRPTHVDGHHHLHMHPAVFGLLCRRAARRGARWIRIPREPLSIPFRFFTPGRGIMPFLELAVFRILGNAHEKIAGEYGLNAAETVYGLARTGRCDERYLTHILSRMRGVAEIFTHPDAATAAGQRELEALISPSVRTALAECGAVLEGYGGLCGEGETPGCAVENA